MKRRRLALVLLVAYGVVSVLDVIGEATEASTLRVVCLWLLMPLLSAFLLVARRQRSRLTDLILVALFFSWLGDIAGTSILIKIAFFLVAQVAYIIGFWPHRHRGAVQRPPVLLAYAVVVVAMVVLVGSEAGPLLLPVIIYGSCLGLMAVLASGLNRLAAIGGAVFVVSDSLLAINLFVERITIPAAGVWIMTTYVLAQAFLVVGGLLGDGAGWPPAHPRRPRRDAPARRLRRP